MCRAGKNRAPNKGLGAQSQLLIAPLQVGLTGSPDQLTGGDSEPQSDQLHRACLQRGLPGFKPCLQTGILPLPAAWQSMEGKFLLAGMF